MNGGFLPVPREVWSWPNPDHARAYVDLQFRACWGQQTHRSQGQEVTVEVGEVLFSVRKAMDWWGWSEKAVRLFMETLEGEGLIAYPEGKQHRRMFRVVMSDYWGEKKGARKGASRGDSKGATKPAEDNDLGDVGAQAGAQGRAQAGARYKEGNKKEDEKEYSVPSEPAAGAAPPAVAQCELVPEEPPPAPAKPTTVVDPITEGAQRVVTALHSALKARGDPGIVGTTWGAQVKMAAAALRQGTPEHEAIAAITWGMGEEWTRKRLRADLMKVLRNVWSDWKESGADERSNGSAGTGGRSGGTAGHGGEAEAGAGSRAGFLNQQRGRWERGRPAA